MHTQTLSMYMTYHHDIAECVIDFSSSDHHEQMQVQKVPQQYLNTIMPILTSALAGICHRFAGQPGFSTGEICEIFSNLLQDALDHRVIRTHSENIINPQMN